LCNSNTLSDIKACLHDVVWDNDLGTASVNPWRMRKAQSNIVHIAGKTGTAQVFENGRYNSHKHRMSFVGYFPEENPQYSCICVIHAPRNLGYYDAGMDCGSVVRNIAEKTMAYTNEYVIEDGELVFAQK
jgi:cell division protein FtsI (penicillin-binding protein 3)